MRAPSGIRKQRSLDERDSGPSAGFLAQSARQIVLLQDRLDRQARQSFSRWSDAGVPPSAWKVTSMKVSLGLDLGVHPKRSADGHSRLVADRPGRRLAAIRVGIGFLRPGRIVERLADGEA